MKKPTDRQARTIARCLITASAGAVLTLSQASCGGLGLGKNDEAKEPKQKRSIFGHVKNNNAWIDGDIQTTRRDRYAASNSTTFAPVEESPVGPAPAPAANGDFALDPDPAAFTPSPSPAPAPSPRSTMAARSPQPEERLQLPTLDSDFPQPGQPAPAIDPYPAPGSAGTSARPVEDEGYIPLQPKLPGAEQIQPPRD